MSSPINYNRYSDPTPDQSLRNDHYLQIRKIFHGIFHEMAKSLALETAKHTKHRNQSMKLKAKKGRKNYRG